MTFVNDDARIVNKLDASLTDDTRVIIYDRHMFIVQSTGEPLNKEKVFFNNKPEIRFASIVPSVSTSLATSRIASLAASRRGSAQASRYQG